MNRRQFLAGLIVRGVVLLGGSYKVFKILACRRVIIAGKVRSYPGRIRTLSDEEIRQVAPWSG